VGRVDWVILAYSLYLFTLNGVIVIAICMGRARASSLASKPSW